MPFFEMHVNNYIIKSYSYYYADYRKFMKPVMKHRLTQDCSLIEQP
jgi:hypothetical protein